ncbi:hypothetical protein [Kribbella catacumbae]|nr:hypothetical protein [Kribbella catacumbae]
MSNQAVVEQRSGGCCTPIMVAPLDPAAAADGSAVFKASRTRSVSA